jgi:hypothetical protein
VTIKRLIIRIILLSVFSISLFTLIKAIYLVGTDGADAWNAVAASLAVITAIISTYGAIRVIEMQEDIKNPQPEPFFDVQSRYGLVHLAVKNQGGGTAHKIQIIWDIPVTNGRGESINFTQMDGQPDIAILLPGETTTVLVDSNINIFAKQNLNYSGTIVYQNASKNIFRNKFCISLETYRKNLAFSSEAPKTHHELQKIPDMLDKIGTELKKINETLNAEN